MESHLRGSSSNWTYQWLSSHDTDTCTFIKYNRKYTSNRRYQSTYSPEISSCNCLLDRIVSLRSFARFSRPPMHVHHEDHKISEPSADRIISHTSSHTNCVISHRHVPYSSPTSYITPPTLHIPQTR